MIPFYLEIIADKRFQRGLENNFGKNPNLQAKKASGSFSRRNAQNDGIEGGLGVSKIRTQFHGSVSSLKQGGRRLNRRPLDETTHSK